MNRKLTVLIAVLMLALAACGGDDDGDAATPAAGGNGDEMPASTCIGEGEELLPEYVGISVDEAYDLAEEQGLQVREVGLDGECFPITMDLRNDRVNLDVVGTMVVGAAIF